MTTDLTGCFLGYDPGGNDGHGVASFRVDESGCITEPRSDTRRTVHGVLDWFRKMVRDLGPVRAVGIDTLTYWSALESGWREADEWLRKRHPEASGSVVALNSMYSSMSVNGMFVLLELRKICPGLDVTETHPKVLHFALADSLCLTDRLYPTREKKDGKFRETKRQFEQRVFVDSPDLNRRLAEWMGVDIGALPKKPKNSHEWDALISAWAALHAKSRAWKINLVSLEKDGDHLLFPATGVEYRWPDEKWLGEFRRTMGGR